MWEEGEGGNSPPLSLSLVICSIKTVKWNKGESTIALAQVSGNSDIRGQVNVLNGVK